MSDPELCNSMTPFNQTSYDTCCPPRLNNEIEGIGVRISFYLQALILSCLSARSNSLKEIANSLITLVATNTAMSITAFILGFKKNAEITLQDATVILYLLTISSISIFFALARLAHFKDPDRNKRLKLLRFFSVLQYYIFFGLALAVLIKADREFGSSALCNVGARVVIFRPFNMLPVGRNLFIAISCVWIAFYTTLTIMDYQPRVVGQVFRVLRKLTQMWIKSLARILCRRRSANNTDDIPLETVGGTDATTTETSSGRKLFDTRISGTLVIQLFLIFTLWGIVVVNTELLIRWNRFKETNDPQWQFGQILAVFLVVIPLIDLYNAFKKFGIYRIPQETNPGSGPNITAA